MGYSNSQCAHIWAQQEKEKGQNNNGNMFWEGPTIYSYGYHFPIATFQTFKGKRCLFINSDSYSISTSGHQSDVRQAVDHPPSDTFYVPTEFVAAFAGGNVPSKRDRKAMLDNLKASMAESFVKSSRARTEWNINHHASAANGYKMQAKHFCEFFGLYVPAWVKSENNKGDFKKALEADKKHRAEQSKRKKQHMAEQKERLELETTEWLACERDAISWVIRDLMPDTLLRVNHAKKCVQTSQGAEFPIEAAIPAFKIVKLCRAKGQEFKRNGENIRLGHFIVDSISKTGDVKAACHFVKWPAIKHAADILGL